MANSGVGLTDDERSQLDTAHERTRVATADFHAALQNSTADGELVRTRANLISALRRQSTAAETAALALATRLDEQTGRANQFEVAALDRYSRWLAAEAAHVDGGGLLTTGPDLVWAASRRVEK
jgi:hypothetical protein